MKRYLIPLAALALAACEPTVPDSAAGVGFDAYTDYESARLARERELRAGVTPVPGARVLASETIGAVDPDIGTPPVAETPAETVAVSVNNPGISDEQDFEAVAERESIESDAERLARQAAAYEVVAPQDLPERRGNAGPNIVEYALSTTNRLGESLYRRSGLNAVARFNRACARFATADEAQREFLERGGPERDRLGVDPDGDGFACYWDPRPFRAARGG